MRTSLPEINHAVVNAARKLRNPCSNPVNCVAMTLKLQFKRSRTR